MLLARLVSFKERVLCFPPQIDTDFIIDFCDAFSCFISLKTDSLERRLLFLTLERIIKYKWQENDFRPFDLESCMFDVRAIFFKILKEILFSKD